MPAFFEYLRNITYYLVFMSLVGVLAPSGNYRKYIMLIMGIMLIGIAVNPFLNFFTGGNNQLPLTDFFTGIQTYNQPHIADNHLREVFHSNLTTQARTLLEGSGYHLISAEWESAYDFSYIRKAFLVVKQGDPSPAERVPFIRIEPVRIAPYQPLSTLEEAPPQAQAVKKLISDFYDMNIANIHVDILER